MTIEEVEDYYKLKYRSILKALKNKKFYDFKIDKDCYGYLQITFESSHYTYTINHGISDKYPYNLFIKAKYWEDRKREHFTTQQALVNRIAELS